MITLHDGEAVPKVIDFAIAKATSQKIIEKTLFTRYEQSTAGRGWKAEAGGQTRFSEDDETKMANNCPLRFPL